MLSRSPHRQGVKHQRIAASTPILFLYSSNDDVVKLLFGASRVHAVGDTYLGEHGVSPSEPCFLTLGFALKRAHRHFWLTLSVLAA